LHDVARDLLLATYGWVYINISRKLPDGHPEEAYDEIPQLD